MDEFGIPIVNEVDNPVAYQKMIDKTITPIPYPVFSLVWNVTDNSSLPTPEKELAIKESEAAWKIPLAIVGLISVIALIISLLVWVCFSNMKKDLRPQNESSHVESGRASNVADGSLVSTPKSSSRSRSVARGSSVSTPISRSRSRSVARDSSVSTPIYHGRSMSKTRPSSSSSVVSTRSSMHQSGTSKSRAVVRRANTASAMFTN